MCVYMYIYIYIYIYTYVNTYTYRYVQALKSAATARPRAQDPPPAQMTACSAQRAERRDVPEAVTDVEALD